ncbi:MAG: HAMP domain-containing histidine kinase [Anaerolineae bacterium]|nr:HAMP domain-containing histidine kinase [Anaerolineae bacterium]
MPIEYDEIAARVAEERRRFLRRLDHELKNPLTAIQVALANLAETDDAESRRRIQAGIQAQIRRLTGLVDSLRKLADLETGPLEHYPIDIADLLSEATVIAQEQPVAADHHLFLNLDRSAPTLPQVIGDRDILLLAVYNLLDNALKFTQPGDTVELRAFADGETVVIEVEDTGPGIPEADQPHVWEELYRSQGAHAVPGSGIGLAMVKAIVERHGGCVGLQSEVGRGTVVTLRLPGAA